MKNIQVVFLLAALAWIMLAAASCAKPDYTSSNQTYWERRHKYDYKDKRYYYPSRDRDSRARWQSRK